MFEKKEMDLPSSKTLTVIAEGVIIEGKLYSRGSTRIDGRVTGEIVSEKELTIGKEGKVDATVKTANAIVAGNFKGDMISSGGVEITSTGKFTGKIIQKDAMLTVSNSGLFKGESIISDNQEIFKFEFPSSGNSNDKESVRNDTEEIAD